MKNKTTPHVVKFSGGRSSGMMLMNMLERNELNSCRGDVIVFNNTSAEHPATYEFTRKIKNIVEVKYNIPFFWIEYQTFEHQNKKGNWTRKPTYRLVNDQPYSNTNPNGYKYKGEVFEEFISFSGYVPNMLSRTCTVSMKIFITNSFLSDWFAAGSGIEELGHSNSDSYISDRDVLEKHERHGGGVPDTILLSKRAYSRFSGTNRRAAKWVDFTNSTINYKTPDTESIKDGKAQLYGDKAIDYVSCIGIRADEYRRIVKIRNRVEAAQGNKGRSLFNQPVGEIILAPLIDDYIVQEDVKNFWNNQDFDLNLPQHGLYSNCLYCPLKGKAKLLQIAKNELTEIYTELTPSNIQWWMNMERKYSRDLKAEGRAVTSQNKTNYVGFFGATENLVYQDIQVQALQGKDVDIDMLELETSMSCNCTD